MVTQRKHIDINHVVANGINQAVLIGDTAAPKTMQLSFNGSGFPMPVKGCSRMSASNFVMRFIMRLSPIAFQYAKSSSALGINFISISLQAL